MQHAWVSPKIFFNTIIVNISNHVDLLALYTGDNEYFDWAEKLYDWVVDHDLIDDQGNVFDGTDVGNGCSDVNRLQYSSNAGLFCQNTAAMWNATKLWGKVSLQTCSPMPLSL